jgi:hypothetical protein
MAKLRESGLSVGQMAQLCQCLSRMGATPADRSKVFAVDPKGAPSVFESLDDPDVLN